ncbi:Flagellar motor rotation protein MotB [Paraburkholderia caribensis]|nr:Flagellar motor rotation protein MotB [Paraburkholderia caribensis]
MAQCQLHWLAAEAGFALLAGAPPAAAAPVADAASDDATASDAAAVPDLPESAAVCAAGGADAPDTGTAVDNAPDAVLLASCAVPSSAPVRCR